MKGERKGELIVGLDLGMNNVGWSLTEQAEDHLEILGMGTLVFSSPLIDLNKPEEGYKSKQRGQHRRQRRTLRHRSTRRKHLYRLLSRLGMLPLDPVERARFLCRNKEGDARVDPFTLRAKAVQQPISKLELGRALCHLNQRRGFLSPRDLMLLGIAKFDPEALAEEVNEAEPGKDEEDTGLILSEIKRTKAEVGARTLGQFLLERVQAGEPVRKKKFSDKKNLPDGTSVKNRINAKRHSELYWVRSDRHVVEAEAMVSIAEKRSPCMPSLLAEPFMGERTDDLETLLRLIQTNPRSMWQYGDHVLIQRDGTSIRVAPIRVKWLGAHSPQVMFDPERAVGELYEIEDMEDEDWQHLVMLIRIAERRRKASFRRCAACGESHPSDELTRKLCGPCFEHSGGVH